MSVKRSKNPEQVKRALLDSAIVLANEEGYHNMSLNKIAAMAGVTKGGLFHHFPNKATLLDALYEDMIGQLDLQIAELMKDDKGYGCFTRAYISLMHLETKNKQRPDSVTLSMIMDKSLSEKWTKWLSANLEKHKKTDGHRWLEVLRLSADGLWLASISGNASDITSSTLIKSTYLEVNI